MRKQRPIEMKVTRLVSDRADSSLILNPLTETHGRESDMGRQAKTHPASQNKAWLPEAAVFELGRILERASPPLAISSLPPTRG